MFTVLVTRSMSQPPMYTTLAVVHLEDAAAVVASCRPQWQTLWRDAAAGRIRCRLHPAVVLPASSKACAIRKLAAAEAVPLVVLPVPCGSMAFKINVRSPSGPQLLELCVSPARC
jgi:hypothetical protein